MEHSSNNNQQLQKLMKIQSQFQELEENKHKYLEQNESFQERVHYPY